MHYSRKAINFFSQMICFSWVGRGKNAGEGAFSLYSVLVLKLSLCLRNLERDFLLVINSLYSKFDILHGLLMTMFMQTPNRSDSFLSWGKHFFKKI